MAPLARLAILCALTLGASLALEAGQHRAVAQIQPYGPIQPIEPTGPMGEWRNPDGRMPDVAQSSDCRSQARREAVQQYPRPSRSRSDRASTNGDEDRRYEKEAWLYEQCMKGKGYAR